MGTFDPPTSGARAGRVLLADEDQVSLTHIRLLLQQSGYEVVVADGGPHALQLLESADPPRLAVLDWTMPGIDGIDICRRLRNAGRRRQVYVILLTRWNQQKDRVEGLEAGADDCLYKPVDVRELHLRLQIGAQIMLERSLRESEERFQSAFECAGIGMAMIKVSGEFLQVNRAWCEFLRHSSDELLATSLLSVSPREDQSAIQALLAQLLGGGRGNREFEHRFVTKGGAIAQASLHISVVHDADDHPMCFVVQAQDITERRKAEQNLQAVHAETELFIRSIPSILIGLDCTGRIRRWNQTAAKTFGLDEPSVMGRMLEDCGIKWLQPDIKSEITNWLKAKTAYRCDSLAHQRDGKTRFLGLNVQPMPSENGETAGFILTGADVTERRGLEDQLRQAQKLEAIGQLAAGVAHEINTPTQFVGDNTTFIKDSWGPIAGLLKLCQTMRQEAGTGGVSQTLLAEFDRLSEQSDLEYLLREIPHAIDQSLDGLQRVTKIVRAMKEFSHPGSEEKRGIDLNKAIETTITVAGSEWKYVAEVLTRFDPNLPLVPCLAGEMNQVVLNLIINAAHAIAGVVGDGSKDKGRITITTRHDGEWAEIAVADTGGGIPPEIRSRIFEPFFTTKPLGKGTGQGLALAHSVIVNRHQGQIWFETEVGRGTTFFLRLPLEGKDSPS